MLFDNGITSRLGKVEDGNTVSDFSQEEQKRQISINTSLITMERKGRQLFVLDTPGFADFVGEMRSAIRVADSLMIAVSGVSGIEVQTDKAWETGSEFNLPIAFYISKLDRENADFGKVLNDIRSDYSDKAVAVFLPVGAEASFKGVVDLLGNKAYIYETDGSGKFAEGDIPADMADEAAQARETLVEAIVEADDELMMRYLDGETISEEELLPALRKAILTRTVLPVFPGSATLNVGVHQILDFIADFFPSPVESRKRPALKGEENVEISPDPAGQFSAICFKVMVDPYVGKLSFIRVNSGSLTSDNTIYNVNKGEEERISSFKFMTGKDGKDAKEITVGDILAIPKLQSTEVGDTLSVKGSNVTFPSVEFPKPVYSVAIIAKSRADEDKLGNAIHKTLEEDPSRYLRKESRDQRQCPLRKWATCISTSSSPASRRGTVLTLRPRPPRFPTVRPSGRQPRPRASTRSRRAATASTATSMSGTPPSSGERASSSRTTSLAAPFPRDSFPPSKRASGKPSSRDPLPASPWWTSRPPSSSAPTTTWTAPKWPSNSPPGCPSRRVSSRRTPCSWSPS